MKVFSKSSEHSERQSSHREGNWCSDQLNGGGFCKETSAAVARAAGLVEGVGTRTPATDDVRELVATDVNVGAVDEFSIADVSRALEDRTVFTVWSNDHVTVSCDSNDIIPIIFRVGRGLT